MDSNGSEVILSKPKFVMNNEEKLNLVSPAEVRPLGPEYSRLADIEKNIGSIRNLQMLRKEMAVMIFQFYFNLLAGMPVS